MKNNITLSSFSAEIITSFLITELQELKKYLIGNFDLKQERYQNAIKIAESVISMLLQQPFENRSKEELKFLIDVYTEVCIYKNPQDKNRLEQIAFLEKLMLDWLAEQGQK